SAIASYAIIGATLGYTPLWLMLLATPLLQSVQYTCAKIGRVTQRGLADLLTHHYGRTIAIPAALLLVIANVALIAADLVAVGTGLQLLTGLNWVWFVVPVAVALWYITVYQNFGALKKIFLTLSLAFVAYLVTGLFSGAHWGVALTDTVIPHVSLSFAGVSGAVALLGATISPYTIFWQTQGEKEEHRPGALPQQMRAAATDIGIGVFSGNLVAYFVIVCAAATLFTHHETITTAADAARSLQPLLGPYATYLFAVGFIGAGLIAIPVLLASASYGVAGTIGWAASLWRKPWQNEGFYLIMTTALVVSLALALLRMDPITLIFWANILQGALTPALVVLLVLLGLSRKVMGAHRVNWLTTVGLIAAAALLTAATLLLFYSLLTGQAG
ncbi:MAG: divalent metal cation transporter, partial [Ktedonobacterales bacterium]